jgi:hypothetical protein
MPPEGGGTVQRSAGSLQLTIDDDDPGMAWADESIRNILGRSPSIHHGDLGWPKSGLRAARAIGLDITIHWLHSAPRNAAARLTQRLLSSPYRLSGCGRGIAMARVVDHRPAFSAKSTMTRVAGSKAVTKLPARGLIRDLLSPSALHEVDQ